MKSLKCVPVGVKTLDESIELISYSQPRDTFPLKKWLSRRAFESVAPQVGCDSESRAPLRLQQLPVRGTPEPRVFDSIVPGSWVSLSQGCL
jgi:hypothetical protein